MMRPVSMRSRPLSRLPAGVGSCPTPDSADRPFPSSLVVADGRRTLSSSPTQCSDAPDIRGYQSRAAIAAGKSGNFTGEPTGARICLVCGCGENSPCVDDRGPCWWVGAGLCSHCADAHPSPQLAQAVFDYTSGRSEIGLATISRHLVALGHAEQRIGGQIANTLRSGQWLRDGWLATPDGPTPRWVRRHMA